MGTMTKGFKRISKGWVSLMNTAFAQCNLKITGDLLILVLIQYIANKFYNVFAFKYVVIFLVTIVPET